MEKLKQIEDVFQPDERNLMFVRFDTGERLTLGEHHAKIADVALNSRVPEDVRSYFATIQNVCVYAWFAYDLYAIVQFLCFTAIEMALKKRFPVSGKDRRGLSELLKRAVRQKLI